MLSNSCHGNREEDFLLTYFFETLTGISNTLQNLTFLQLSVDEIVGGGGGGGRYSSPPWYKVWVQNSLL